MIKIKNYEEFEESLNKIPVILQASIAGEIYMFDTLLCSSYYNNKKCDEYGPLVIFISSEEYKNISEKIPTIEKEKYEYKEIVGLTSSNYYTKYVYLFNNGESGIICYVETPFYNIDSKFSNDIYVTVNAMKHLGEDILHYLASFVEKGRCALNGKLDYLQVFEISKVGTNLLLVNHRQEVPEYNSYYYITDVHCDPCKVFWISETNDEGKEYSTILMAEDY